MLLNRLPVFSLCCGNANSFEDDSSSTQELRRPNTNFFITQTPQTSMYTYEKCGPVSMVTLISAQEHAQGCLYKYLLAATNSENAATASINHLIAKIHCIDKILREIQSELAQVEHGIMAQQWHNLSERFRVSLTKSKLVASSMTVLLSEFQNVILASLLSRKVEAAVVLVELESLKRTVNRRREELMPADRDHLIGDVCQDIQIAASKLQADLLDDRKMRRRCKGELSSALSKLAAMLDGCMVVDDLGHSHHGQIALQIDIIAYVYTMFQCELLGLAKAMARGEDMASDPCITATFGLYNNLICMLDLYSKQALLL